MALTAAASTGPVRSLIRENRPEGRIPFRSLQRTVAATGGSSATAMVNDVAMMEQRVVHAVTVPALCIPNNSQAIHASFLRVNVGTVTVLFY